MKKFAIMAAIAISALNFGSVEAAAPVGVDNSALVETGAWTSFRDSITGKRERDREAQAREEYWRERQAREDYQREREAREQYQREREARERYEQERREREAREQYQRERREREAREQYQRERTRNDPNYNPPSLDAFRDK